MKKEYDFSKGERENYTPVNESPLFYINIALEKGVSIILHFVNKITKIEMI